MIGHIVTFVSTQKDGLDAYVAAGEYFNAFYGLPIGLIGATFGLLAALIAALIASRQGDIQIFEFVEGRIKPTVQSFKQFSTTVGGLLGCGNYGRSLGEDLMTALVAEGDDGPLQALIDQSAIEFRDPVDAQAFIDSISNIRDRDLMRRTWRFLTDLQDRTGELWELFDDLTVDLYASLFAREQYGLVPQNQRPLSVLGELLPINAQVRNFALGDTMHEVADDLRHFASLTKASELPQSSVWQPDDNLTIDFLGHVLWNYRLTPRRLVQHRGLQIARYDFNFGAAYLLTIAQYVPDKSTILSVFDRLFPNRGGVAKNFLQVAMPEKDQLGLPYILGSLKKSYDDLSRLVIVQVVDGDAFRSEYYNSARHGPIPQSGYVEFEDLSPAIHVRR